MFSDFVYVEYPDVTSARDVAVEETLGFTHGLYFVYTAAASRFEVHVADHAFLEGVLDLFADLSTDPQKAFEGRERWPHDLHHLLGVHEGVLEDVLVDGIAQLLW
jgi:hypothetical protein